MLWPGKHMDGVRRQSAAVNVQTSHAAPLALQLSRKTQVEILRTGSMRAHVAAMPLNGYTQRQRHTAAIVCFRSYGAVPADAYTTDIHQSCYTTLELMLQHVWSMQDIATRDL